MSISDIIPTLQPMVEKLSVELRFVCYFILTASLIVRISRHQFHEDMSTLVGPIVTVTLLTGIIATLPFWFNLLRDTFWNIAMMIREEFASSVAPTGTALLQLIKPPDDGINWLDVSHSLMKAVQYALGWLIVFLGAVIQFPMMLVQFVMECLCYLFLPIALALLAIESTRSLAIHYIQQTLAILAWPVGFAVVDLVGYSLLNSYVSVGSATALAIGAATKFTPATLVIGCLVAVWLILGSLGTPIVMQMLFCSGSPMSSGISQAMQMGLMLAGFSRLGGKGGGPSAPSATGGSTPPNSPAAGSSPSQPPPPQLPPGPSSLSPVPTSPKPSLPSGGGSAQPTPGHTLPRPQPPTFDLQRDPTGDAYVVDLKNLNQIPQPVSY